ncbi:MAG: hypothetical protein PF448_06425 [Bacteroidales bacterium]|jgi:hypothetical protein|nr:hypothetical protein [Bacteroidales bacterium]
MNKLYYILKGNLYYRPNNSGYTSNILDAGAYPQEHAESCAKHCDEIRIKPVDINTHNQLIIDQIKDLANRIQKDNKAQLTAKEFFIQNEIERTAAPRDLIEDYAYDLDVLFEIFDKYSDYKALKFLQHEQF